MIIFTGRLWLIGHNEIVENKSSKIDFYYENNTPYILLTELKYTNIYEFNIKTEYESELILINKSNTIIIPDNKNYVENYKIRYIVPEIKSDFFFNINEKYGNWENNKTTRIIMHVPSNMKIKNYNNEIIE